MKKSPQKNRETAVSWSVYFIHDHSRVFLGGLIALVIISLYSIATSLKVDNTLKIWFSDEDPNYQTFLEFQDKYGNDDIITVLATYPFQVYEEEAVRELLKLEKELNAIEYVDQVYSFASSDFLEASDYEFSIEKIASKAPKNEEEKSRLIDRITRSPAIKNTFISNDEKSYVILIRLNSFEKIEVQRDNIVRDIKSVIDQTLHTYHMGGLAVLNEALNKTVAKESLRFSLVSYIVMISLLGLVIRKRRFLFLVVPIIFVPMVLTFGLFAATGYSLNMISMTLPTILMVYALADAIHLINNYLRHAKKYPHLNKRDLINRALNYSFKPCLYASLTTMLAYISFYLSPFEVLKTTGLFAFIGLGIAFMTVYIISIIGFVMLKEPTQEKEWKVVDHIDRWIIKFSDVIINLTSKNQLAIILGFILVFASGVLFISDLEINTYPGEYLNKNTKVRQDSEYIEEKFGGYLPFEIIIRSTTDQKIITTKNLILLEKFQKKIASETQLSNPTSIVDAVKYLSQQLSPDQTYALPASDQVTSQLLLLYEMDESNRLRELTDVGYTEARVTGRVKMLSAKDFGTIINQINVIFNQLNAASKDLELIPQGYLPLYVHMVNYITSSLLYSFLGAFVLIGIFMFLFIRKTDITIISLISNLIPLSIVVILMYWFSIPLDMGTVMIAAIMLGIAVDDTMHLVHAYFTNRKLGKDKSASIDYALKTTMPALIISTAALALGFLIIGMSSLKSLQNFGFLCAATVTFTFIADILLLPSIVKIAENLSKKLFTFKLLRNEASKL